MTVTDPLALATMVAYCGWDPTEVVDDQEIKLDGNGTALLTLPSLYVTDVSAVQILRRDSQVTDAAIGPGEEVDWSENGTLTWSGCGPWPVGTAWPEGKRNVLVTYSGGYQALPADLAAALASLTKRVSGPLFGMAGTRMGTAAVTFGQQMAAGGLLMVEEMVFDKYRIVRSA